VVSSPLRLITRDLFYQLNTCGHSPYVISSLTTRWICRLQLLLFLASAVIPGSESRGTHDHILLSQIRDSPNLEDQVPEFISWVTGWPSYIPRHSVFFSKTRRAIPPPSGKQYNLYVKVCSVVEMEVRGNCFSSSGR
jgi:hypothetical protein